MEFGAKTAARALMRAARKSFQPVIDAAIANCVEDTGELRASITISTKRPGAGDTVVVVGLRIGKRPNVPGKLPPARRWHFVEFGTAHTRARPFLRPAFDQNAAKVAELMAVEINKQIASIRKRGGKR